MKRTIMAVVLLALAGAPSTYAVSWTLVGTSGFTVNTSEYLDYNRIRINDLVVDNDCNVYITVANGNNNGVAGGVTIFHPNGTKTDVNVNALGFPGNVTKLVLAGDGSVYGVQNWLEINWNFDSGLDSRILRFNPNGTVDLVHNNGNNGQFNTPFKRIQGFAVGGDGNIYFTRNPQNDPDKYNFFFRYKVVGTPPLDVIEPSPMNGTVNNGWLDGNRFFDLEYVGGGWFAVVDVGGNNWTVAAISWTDFRRVATNGSANPGWGRDHSIDLDWDPVNNVLWSGARGASDRLILSRWRGQTGGSSLFTIPSGVGNTTDPAPGIQSAGAGGDSWHADADQNLGQRWVSALACHPTTGDAWMAFAGTSAYNFNLRGHVIRVDANRNNNSEGAPETNADVVAIGFYHQNNTPLAVTFNRNNGQFKLYRGGPVPANCSAATPTPTNTPTPACSDVDRDGVCDSAEHPNLNLPPTGTNIWVYDSDGDGLRDGLEDTNGNGVKDANETSARNRDTDGDNFRDSIERILATDPLVANSGYADTDADGIPNANDPNPNNKDTDGDRYLDGYEAGWFQDFAAANDANRRPPLGDADDAGGLSNLDALVTQALFLGNAAITLPVFKPGTHDGFRFLDTNLDGAISNVDALVINAFFLGNLPQIPLTF